MKKQNSPLKWQGGKFKLRKDIVKLIPKHTCYCEVFGGAGWVLFYKDLNISKVEVYNDINSQLVNFFRVIQNKENEFLKKYKQLLISREIFEEFKTSNINILSDVDMAVRFFYLVHYSFGCKMQSFLISPLRSITNNTTNNINSTIKKAKDRLNKVIIENRSFEKVLDSYDRKETFFYLDPPYYKTANYKTQGSGEFKKEDHENLFKKLSNINGKFLLSINDHKFIRELYKDFYIKEISIKYSIAKGKAKSKQSKELLIANYDIHNIE